MNNNEDILGGMLNKLQRAHEDLVIDAVGVSDQARHQLIAKLINTAIQEYEALPKPDCDEPGCLLQGIAHSHTEEWGPICAECARPLTLPMPEGDLTAWQAELISRLRLHLAPAKWKYIQDHLAVMPAQPDVNKELLKALKGLVLAISEGNTYHPKWSEEDRQEPASNLISIKAQEDAQAAIDAAEKTNG